jgi:streptomycin 6-kinase
VATLARTADRLAERWSLELGPPLAPGATAAWVAPARDRRGRQLILKVGPRHSEAEHEADALRLWDGDGAVRCYASELAGDTSALLLERAVPGVALGDMLPEPEQDVVVAGLLRRLWAHAPPPGCFRPLQVMCDEWADSLTGHAGLAREAADLLRSLPRNASREALLCTDLHAGNILSSTREPWLVIDPKPYVGDPAYDVVQHMLNCRSRLATDPLGMCTRLADLLELDLERVRLWLFARCAQESVSDPAMGAAARRLSP